MTYLLVVLVVIVIVVGGALTLRFSRGRATGANPLAGRDLFRRSVNEPPAAERLPDRAGPTLVDEGGPQTLRRREARRSAVKTAAADQGVGLAITALASDPDQLQHDVYYVQRNVIALARGLRPVGAEQRAAALTLSAVMSSRLGRDSEVADALAGAVDSANQVVRSISSRDLEYSDMITTLDILCLGPESKRPALHFAHIGSSSIWLLRRRDRTIQTLSEPQIAAVGQPLRAVGMSDQVLPQIGATPVHYGDRLIMASATTSLALTSQIIRAVLTDPAQPLRYWATALAEAARSAGGATGSITILAVEVSRDGFFSA